MPWSDAYTLAARSKVVVSPWGVCELSWRDYEAVLGGAIIVKPRQPYIYCSAQPWITNKGGNFVFCDPDFSDLRGAVERALNMYDEAEDRLIEYRENIIRYGGQMINLAIELKGVLTSMLGVDDAD